MKKIIAILAALLALGLTACDSKTSEPTQAPDRVTTPAPTGPDASVAKTVYVHASITQEYGATVSRTEYVFDEKDWVTEVIVYTNDVETKRHSVECDKNGNFIRWTSDGSVTEYSYDDRGHSLGMTMYIGGQLVSTTAYTWENDLRTSVTTTMAGQSMMQKVLMTYDSDGKLLRQDSYNVDTLISYSIYAYDANGRTATMTTYQPDGSLYSIGKYSWKGNALTIVTNGADGALMQTAELTYDDAGNLLSHTVFDASGEQVSKETHTWKAIEVELGSVRASV